MSSNSTGDGRFTISVTFELGTNLDIAQVQVQNRVAIAQPRLPIDVRNIGVTVNKSSPDLMMVVHLYSPDKSRDTLFISNYATIEITRRADPRRRRRLDHRVRQPRLRDARLARSRPPAVARPDRERRRHRAAGQNVQVAAGVLNQPPMDKPGAFQISVQTLGRLTEPERVRQHRRQADRQRGRAHEGRRAGRARRAGLLDQLLSRSRPGDRARHLPAARLERARDREERSRPRWRSSPSASRPG